MWVVWVQDQREYFWKDICIGIVVMVRCRSASWQEFLGGSKLFFWGWPYNHRYQSRYGVKAWISVNFLRFRKPKYLNNQSDLTLINIKLGKLRERRHISMGQIRILTRFFSVPKGENRYSDVLLWNWLRV